MCNWAKGKVSVREDRLYTRESQALTSYATFCTHRDIIHEMISHGYDHEIIHEMRQLTVGIFLDSPSPSRGSSRRWTGSCLPAKAKGEALGFALSLTSQTSTLPASAPYLIRAKLKLLKVLKSRPISPVKLCRGFQLLFESTGLEACALGSSCLNERGIPAQHGIPVHSHHVWLLCCQRGGFCLHSNE